MEKAVGTTRACAILGKARARLHRHRNPTPPRLGPRRPFHHPAELSDDEREHVLAVLDSPRFADKSRGQVWAILLDEGVYLCSQATMYRLLRERGQAGERRAQATHPAKKKPELQAEGPNQVWSWDITKLKGPARGVHYLLYVIIDIFSRKSVHWEIWPTENGTLAKEFLQNAIAANDGTRPDSIHADRGTSMTSNTVTGLLALLAIDQSHSRPHVCQRQPLLRSTIQNTQILPGVPGTVRVHRRRQGLLHPILQLLQQRTSPFRDRDAHSRIGARRHRRPHPGQADRHPQRSLPDPPRTVPRPTPPAG